MNKLKMIMIVVVFMSQGCAKEYSHFIEPELAPYVDEFFALRDELWAGPKFRERDNITVTFGDTGSAFGSCNHNGIVIIDKKKWDDDWRGPNWKWGAIFHELGHCVLFLEHDNETIPNHDHGIPKIMNVILPGDKVFERYGEIMIQDLFGLPYYSENQ